MKESIRLDEREIYLKLKDIRKSKKISLRKLETLSHVSRSTIDGAELGERSLNLGNLLNILDILGYQLDIKEVKRKQTRVL